MLEDEDALPRTEGQSATRHRYRDLHGGERRPDVGGHVVRPFAAMDIVAILRRRRFEEGREVRQHVRIGVLLDQQGCRGMAAKQG